jgi:hypothetical protein
MEFVTLFIGIVISGICVLALLECLLTENYGILDRTYVLTFLIGIGLCVWSVKAMTDHIKDPKYVAVTHCAIKSDNNAVYFVDPFTNIIQLTGNDKFVDVNTCEVSYTNIIAGWTYGIYVSPAHSYEITKKQ